MRLAFPKLPRSLALFAFSAFGAAPPLPIPATGAYLGIWANPAFGGVEAAIQMREGPAPYGINRTFALHLHYYPWDGLAKLLNAQGVLEPDTALAGDIARGRVPVISWSCDQLVFDSDRAIASGDSAEDVVITATARALAQYPGPVLLRWFWQFNLLTGNAGCRGETAAVAHPAQSEYDNFIAAWRRIRQLFQDAGASNVSFLWNPGYYSPATRPMIRMPSIPVTSTSIGSVSILISGPRRRPSATISSPFMPTSPKVSLAASRYLWERTAP